MLLASALQGCQKKGQQGMEFGLETCEAFPPSQVLHSTRKKF